MENELDEFHFHEVLHVASIMVEFWDEHIVQHQAVRETAELEEAAEVISRYLMDFYQLAGKVSYEQQTKDQEKEEEAPEDVGDSRNWSRPPTGPYFW